MLTTLLPWAALLLVVLALLVRDGTRPIQERDGSWLQRLRPSWSYLWAEAALIVVILGAGFFWKDELKNLWLVALGFAGGAAVVGAALKLSRIPSQPLEGIAAPVALGVFGSAIWSLIPVDAREPYQLGAAVGAGLAGWLLAGAPGGKWPARTSIFMAFALAADILGKRAAGGHSAQAGSVFGLLIGLGLIVALGIPRKPETEARNRLIGVALALVLFVAGGWLLAGRHFFIHDIWILFAGTAGVGLIVAWLVPDEVGQSSFNFVLSVIVWLAVATLAFGLRRGYGMSVSLLGGAAMLGVLGRNRAMLTLGPLAILVVYRVLREMSTDATRALDIGQHYAIIGLAIGAALPLLVSEWRSGGTRRPWAAILWCPVLLAVPFVGGVVLAAKGYIGLLAGLGFGTVIEGFKGGSRLEVLSLQAGLSMAMVAGYDWVAPKLNLARVEKISTLIWVAVGLGVLAVLIALLSRNGREEPAGSTT